MTVFLSERRADFVDDEYIQDLIQWTHPHAVAQPDFQYTEEENAAMLRLPRKECEQLPYLYRRVQY